MSDRIQQIVTDQSGSVNDVSSNNLYADVAKDPSYGVGRPADSRTLTSTPEQIEFNSISGYDAVTPTRAITPQGSDKESMPEILAKTDSTATRDLKQDLQKEALKKDVLDAYKDWDGKADPKKVAALEKFVTGMITIGNQKGGVEGAKKELAEAIKELNKALEPKVHIALGEAPKELQDQLNQQLKGSGKQIGYMPSVLIRDQKTGEYDIVGAVLIKGR